jgi:hypothetical protein
MKCLLTGSEGKCPTMRWIRTHPCFFPFTTSLRRWRSLRSQGRHAWCAKKRTMEFVMTMRRWICQLGQRSESYMRIGDYCQEMENPYFGAEQTADIYYMSAVTIKVFGLIDPAGTSSVNRDNLREYRNLLKAYVYDESVAGCGGNNVACLFIKDLHNGSIMDQSKGPRDTSSPCSTISQARTRTITS